MTKSYKIFLILFSLMSILVAGVGWLLNPELKVITQAQLDLDDKLGAKTLPVVLEKVSSMNLNMTFVFQGNSQRQGIYLESLLPKEGSVKVLFPEINVDLHTAMKSIPAVDESGIYIGSDTGWFYKLSKEGKVLWSHFAESSGKGFHGTALLTEDHVFIGSYGGHFYCFEKESGALIWVHRLGMAIGASAVMSDGFLYLSVENKDSGFVVKLNPLDGQSLWRSPLWSAALHASPVISEDGQIVISADLSGEVKAMDVASGEFLWSYGTGAIIRSTPVIFKNQVFVSNFKNTLLSFNVKTGELLWERRIDDLSISSISINVEEELGYVATAKATLAIRLGDGTTVAQVNKPKHKNYITPTLGSMKGHGKVVVASCAEQELCFYSLSLDRTIKKMQIPGVLNSSVSLFQDALYMGTRSAGGLLVYD